MAPTTRSSANAEGSGDSAIRLESLQSQMAALMARIDGLEAEQETRERQLAERDLEIRRLRDQRENQSTDQSQPDGSPAPPSTSSAPPPASLGTASIASGTKPMTFKGDKYDGTPKNLSRFLNRLENDFAIYSANFPSDAVRVAYAMSSLGERPTNGSSSSSTTIPKE